MFTEIAIIALSVLNQIGLINADHNQDVFLGQFFNAGQVKGAQVTRSTGWNIYSQNLPLYEEKQPLPWKVKDTSLTVDAKSAFAMDNGTDKVFFEKNAHQRRPIASLTKIMTALVVLEKSSLDDTVTITPKAMDTFGDKKDLVAGEKIRMGDLLKIMWIDSNNAAAYALAEHAGTSEEGFVALMNEKADKLGLKDTRFYNPTGLDEVGGENYSTVYDLAQLTQYALKEDLIWQISRTEEATLYSLDRKQRHYVKNTDELLGNMDNIYGGKTGYTTDAGQCLLLVSESADHKRKVISVVLDAKDRFAETRKLVDWVFDNFRW
jgi:D-alanyl-D-alanine carboxypeptidase (penicillin-binding protein 5/6)